jgi:CheY-like chemotaxis protein
VPNTKEQVPTILIADDNEDNRVLFTEILDAEHYRIVHADDGDEALRLVEEGEIDLVLSDVMMPRRSGFAVCRALKSNPDTRLIPVFWSPAFRRAKIACRG